MVQFLRDELSGEFDLRQLRENDSKYAKLKKAIRDFWSQHPGEKIVLFAYFKPTLYYLSERLREDGMATLLLTGDETRDKQEIVDEFSRPDTAPILLSYEVGSEGLDLQFASALVTYDLPWNPMVVEQRIGRIHRIGQKAEQIVVINLVCEDTVDERIYDRLYSRLDLFQRTLGDLEAVIGPLINDLTKNLLSLRPNAQRELERIETTALAMQEKIRLEEELEHDASVLAAYGDYVINHISAAHERGDWIHAGDLEAFVLSFFRRVFPATRIQGVNQSERVFEIELDQDASHHFDLFLNAHRLRGQTRLATLERRRLRFDNRVFTASVHGVEVVHQAHPLIRFIGHHLRVNRLVQPAAIATEIHESSRPNRVAPGLYAFISQRWTAEGLRSYEKLHYEVVSLETGQPVDDAADAAVIVETAAALGQECDDIPQHGEELLTRLASIAGELQDQADVSFHRYVSRCKNENEDRKRIQLLGIDRFEERRSAALTEVLARHRAAGPGREGLVAATKGQLDSLRSKCAAQRHKIERKQTTEDSVTIAAGFILIR